MKYTINYTYDDETKKYVAASADPSLFGFIIYANSFDVLRRSCIRVLRMYTHNDKLGKEDVDMCECELDLGMQL